MRPLAATLALLAALALAACGGGSTDSSGDFEGDERDVASAVERLQTAADEDDASEICRTLLAPSLIERLGGDGPECRQAVRDALDASDSTELEVEAVRVSNAEATARVTSGSGENATTREVRLMRDGRNWKIAAL